MLLRPSQQNLVERSVKALHEVGNALSIAPTGAGKTVMFSEIIGRLLTGTSLKAIVLAHRDELTDQTVQFEKINPSIQTSVFDASQKSWDGQVTFAMVPTLSRLWKISKQCALRWIYSSSMRHITRLQRPISASSTRHASSTMHAGYSV